MNCPCNFMLIIVVALACMTRCHAQETPAPNQPCDSKIAFMSDRVGNQEIYTVNPDGRELARLTDHVAKDGFPIWAPDGRSIAFVSDRDGEDQIFVIDADGANIRKLTNAPGRKKTPCWAPDGNRLAFVTKSVIHILDRRNGRTTQLCKGTSLRGRPTGQRLPLSRETLPRLL